MLPSDCCSEGFSKPKQEVVLLWGSCFGAYMHRSHELHPFFYSFQQSIHSCDRRCCFRRFGRVECNQTERNTTANAWKYIYWFDHKLRCSLCFLHNVRYPCTFKFFRISPYYYFETIQSLAYVYICMRLIISENVVNSLWILLDNCNWATGATGKDMGYLLL